MVTRTRGRTAAACRSRRGDAEKRVTNGLGLRPKGRQPRFPLMNQLSPDQVRQMGRLAAVYRGDLLDPFAWEALLVMLEVCNILDLPRRVMETILGAGMIERVETMSGEVPRRSAPPPGALRRAWVWLPGASGPKPYAVTKEGMIWVWDWPREE